MSKKRGKQVRQREQPSEGKAVRQAESPESVNRLTIAWRISRFDWDGPWGEQTVKGTDLRKWCCDIETMTWAEVSQAAGGKKKGRGTNHHSVEVVNLSKAAQDRLRELPQSEDVDTLFSFRIDGKKRLYGIRDGRAFCALWYDPDHRIYPSKKKHT